VREPESARMPRARDPAKALARVSRYSGP
jgi:hypothetical protein